LFDLKNKKSNEIEVPKKLEALLSLTIETIGPVIEREIGRCYSGNGRIYQTRIFLEWFQSFFWGNADGRRTVTLNTEF